MLQGRSKTKRWKLNRFFGSAIAERSMELDDGIKIKDELTSDSDSDVKIKLEVHIKDEHGKRTMELGLGFFLHQTTATKYGL